MSSHASVDDDRAAAFSEHRPLLFAIAYRMLGSVADAEDIVQDAFLRWQRANGVAVRSARNYLSTTVTRLALDHLRSARVQREVYVGPWLPEPLVGATADDPRSPVNLGASLSMAFLVLLERLTPRERAAFLLREVFEFDYPAIARILKASEASSRQLVQRAKKHIAAGRPRFEPNAGIAKSLADQFLTACTTGDTKGLVSLLALDAVAWADGGGKFSAARRPVRGADRVARFAASVVRKWATSGELRVAPVNGGPGLLLHTGGRLRAVMTIELSPDGRHVDSVYIVVNPDKLHGENLCGGSSPA